MDTEQACWTLRSQPRYVDPPAHRNALDALRAAGFTRAIFGKPSLHPKLGHAVWPLLSVESGEHLREAYTREDSTLYRRAHPDFATGLFWERSRLAAYVHTMPHVGSVGQMCQVTLSLHDPAVLAQFGGEWILDSDRISVTPV